MYFEIDESHPDISPVGSVMSWREGVLLSIIVHLAMVIFLLVAPQFLDGAPLDLHAALILSLIGVSIATTIHLAIVLAGSGLHGWLTTPGRTRIVRRIFALQAAGRLRDADGSIALLTDSTECSSSPAVAA